MKKIAMFMVLPVMVLFLLGCKLVDELIHPDDEVGAYLSVKLRIKVTFKGLNSSGKRKITIDGEERILEDFFYEKTAAEGDDCAKASKDMSHSFEVTVNTKDFKVQLEYINWDFVHFAHDAKNYKLLCSEWSVEVLEYNFEDGKKDPGTPVLDGFEELALDVGKHCQSTGDTKHDCLTIATVSIKAKQNKKGTDTLNLKLMNIKTADGEFY
jgi:hypothetical protein